MKRISSLFALGLLSLGLTTSAQAQTKTSQLIITNTTGTTKLSQMANGLDINNKVVIHNPNVQGNTVTLIVPSDEDMGNANFMFPTDGGTLLTSTATDLNGNAIISAINAGTSTINSARLDLSGVVAGLSSVAAGNPSLTIGTVGGDVTAVLNVANPNAWTGVQTLPINPTQGNALINSINAGTVALTGYATTAMLSNYATLTDLSNAILTGGGVASTRKITTVAPLAGGGDLSADRALSLNINSTLAVDLSSGNLTLNLNNANTWNAVQTFQTTTNQGNNFVNAINNANVSLANYVSNSSLATTLANYSTTTQMNTAISNAVANTLTVSAPLTKTGTNIGLSTTSAAGTYTNATVTVDNYGRVTSATNGVTISGLTAIVAGKISVVKTGAKVADGVITNAAINANSQILVSCFLDANSTEEQYVASLVSVNPTTHQMVVRAQRNGGGTLASSEGCTISYLILNP